MQVQSLSQEDPLEKGMATHSSILDWRLPWTEKSVTGYSPQGCKESDTAQVTEHTFTPREQNKLGSCKTEDLGVQNLPTAAHNNPRIIHLQNQEIKAGRPYATCLGPCACLFRCSVMSDSQQLQGLYPTRLLCLLDSPGKSTGVGWHFFLCLLNCRRILTTQPPGPYDQGSCSEAHTQPCFAALLLKNTGHKSIFIATSQTSKHIWNIRHFLGKRGKMNAEIFSYRSHCYTLAFTTRQLLVATGLQNKILPEFRFNAMLKALLKIVRSKRCYLSIIIVLQFKEDLIYFQQEEAETIFENLVMLFLFFRKSFHQQWQRLFTNQQLNCSLGTLLPEMCHSYKNEDNLHY